MEAAALTNLDLVFDDDWAVYESYLADLCPAEPGPGPGPPDGTVLVSSPRVQLQCVARLQHRVRTVTSP